MFQHSLDTLEMLGLDTGTVEVVENIGTELGSVKLGRGYLFVVSEEAIQGSGELRSIPLPEGRGVDVVAVSRREEENRGIDETLLEAYPNQI